METLALTQNPISRLGGFEYGEVFTKIRRKGFKSLKTGHMGIHFLLPTDTNTPFLFKIYMFNSYYSIIFIFFAVDQYKMLHEPIISIFKYCMEEK